ncbi:MAG: amidohydrolase family protein [Burkholderiales bacterium]
MARFLHDPAGTRLPIKLDATTNGEFAPIPLADIHRRARALAMERATGNARRTGLTRRSFLVSACGAATTLLAFNDAFGSASRPAGGYYDLPREAALDAQVARSSLDKSEFVFDVQGHFVNPAGAWTRSLPPSAQPLRFATNRANCSTRDAAGLASLGCIGRDAFLKDVFLDSDTDVIVLSFVPSTREGEPLTIEEAAATAAIVEGMQGTHRMLLHGRVNPNQPGDLESMDMLAQEYRVAAFKTYTQWGPDGKGFFLDDDVGIAFVEKARRLGVRNIAVHKGLPFGPQSYEHSTCVDVGRIARRFPDVNFLVYHSGFVAGKPEGPYDPKRTDGIDALVTSLLANDVKPGSNVYAELGSTWRFLMRDPESSAHAVGKLVKYCGEKNVLWGTDSIWYGSPQDQIQAFRTFQIGEALVEKHGYARMTRELRAGIFGRNALAVYALPDAVLKHHLPRDRVTLERENYRNAPDPTFLTRGPRTRREFLNLTAWARE